MMKNVLATLLSLILSVSAVQAAEMVKKSVTYTEKTSISQPEEIKTEKSVKIEKKEQETQVISDSDKAKLEDISPAAGQSHSPTRATMYDYNAE
ncbi:MAG: hypothetical protein DI586_09020 [Micavibrio aeruginosavorus]|uniref:Uncharacterized protein n=1 Tax=Micavibrio aeruginosavorus TaxID=349221 RepID=A0A2W5H9F7_9BACT|nr:MAG: hypothetical protein DI586_09020 [Micavibrio aeruginosavorus]